MKYVELDNHFIFQQTVSSRHWLAESQGIQYSEHTGLRGYWRLDEKG